MSFILDALRKSERERQRKLQPGIASMQVHKPRRGAGFWIPLVALLVGINLSLVFVMWVMGDRQQPAVTNTSPTAEVPAPQPELQPTLDSRPNPQPESSVSAQPAGQMTPGQELDTLVSGGSGTLTTLQKQSDIYYANASEEFDNLPSMELLILQNVISLEPLRLDIHVYSQKPAERFVFINMAKYTEGDLLAEGPKLITINEAGVVLLHQGHEFQVTRE
jgi:general secretion pathway protein B